MKKEVVAHRDPKSPISEIFRTLRTNIQFINTNKNTQTLLITSTLPGEGKSWIASNLAVTFAQTGKKVVLVDADMRKGRQYTIFDTPPAPGLSNYLSQVGISEKTKTTDDITECIRKTAVPNLYLMPAGSIPPNPSELLVSPKMIKVLEKFKQAFEIVIIDGTPCELVTDAVILSRIVDSTMIVTAHKVTKKDALERVIKSIQNVGGNLTGVVVNKMPISGKKYEKKYYYYGESSSRLEKESPKEELTSKLKKEPKEETNKKLKKEEKPVKETKEKEEAKQTKTTTKKTSTKPISARKRKTTKEATQVKKTVQENKNRIATTKEDRLEEKKEKEVVAKPKTARIGKKSGTKTETKNDKTETKKNKTETKNDKTETKNNKTETKTKAKTTKTRAQVKEEILEKEGKNTEDILKKMNEYLENENAKKKKGEEND